MNSKQLNIHTKKAIKAEARWLHSLVEVKDVERCLIKLLTQHGQMVRTDEHQKVNEHQQKIYCELCGYQPVIVEEPRPDASGEHVYGDIMCGTCHLVIGTITYDMTADYALSLSNNQ